VCGGGGGGGRGEACLSPLIISGITIDQLSLRFPSYAEMESTDIMNKLKLVCHCGIIIVACKQQGTVNPILGSQYLLSSVVQRSWAIPL